MTATTAVPRAELQDPRAQADAEMPDACKLLADQRRRSATTVRRSGCGSGIVLLAISRACPGRWRDPADRFRPCRSPSGNRSMASFLRLSEAEWQEELERYRQIPEYQLINKGMSLDEFKVIYWWEWAHRLSGARRWRVCLPFRCIFFPGDRPSREGTATLAACLAFWCWVGFRVRSAGGWSPPDWLSASTSANTGWPPTSRSPALIFAAIVWVMRGLAPHSSDPVSRAPD
jgi:hypothetical protein